jgi:hypothetical protein
MLLFKTKDRKLMPPMLPLAPAVSSKAADPLRVDLGARAGVPNSAAGFLRLGPVHVPDDQCRVRDVHT